MVTFSRTPYAAAVARAQAQDRRVRVLAVAALVALVAVVVLVIVWMVSWN
jgi:hypothetical protein